MDSTEWDARYSATALVWSEGPNVFLAREAERWEPGDALDLAAGEGRNSIFLAERGFRVTAVDFSKVGLDKGRARADALGPPVAERISWVRADLHDYEPPTASFDLVIISYLHLAHDELATILRRASRALRTAGTMFIIGHDVTNLTEGTGGPQDPAVLYDAGMLADTLRSCGLEVLRAERVTRPVEGTRAAIDTLVMAEQPPALEP